MIIVTVGPTEEECQRCLEECLRALKRPSVLTKLSEPVYHWQGDDHAAMKHMNGGKPLGEEYRFIVRWTPSGGQMYYHFTVLDSAQTIVHWQQYTAV